MLRDFDVDICAGGAGSSVSATFSYRVIWHFDMLYVSNDRVLLSGMRRHAGSTGIVAYGMDEEPEISSGCFAWRINVDSVLERHDM